MYGFVLEGVAEAVKRLHGQDIWDKVRQRAGVKQNTFLQKKTYSETIVPRLIKAGTDITGLSDEELLEECGKHFIQYVNQFGYDRVMRVLGRHLTDFLNGLDNLHDYLRFTYPKMRSPSFFCEDESESGMTLHYRSKRKGYLYYVIGQVKTVAQNFYDTPITIEIINENETPTLTHITMKLYFNNTAFQEEDATVYATEELGMPLSYDILYEVFPFHIVFNRNLQITNIGASLWAAMPQCVGQAIDEMFILSRPLVEFNIENVRKQLSD